MNDLTGPASTIWEEKAKSNYNTDQTRDGPESELKYISKHN